ncbi:MAG: helix-turn-helix transcriptional regulator [Rikenellaceae bacterium]
MEIRIKEVCKEKGVTQKQLSELSGIAEVSLSKSINGNPTIGTLEKIATALGVEVVELFEKRGDFVAFVSMGGVNHRFDSVETLKSFVNGLE